MESFPFFFTEDWDAFLFYDNWISFKTNGAIFGDCTKRISMEMEKLKGSG